MEKYFLQESSCSGLQLNALSAFLLPLVGIKTV